MEERQIKWFDVNCKVGLTIEESQLGNAKEILVERMRRNYRNLIFAVREEDVKEVKEKPSN